MSTRIVPTEVPVSDAASRGFSSRNYARVGIARTLLAPLRHFLHDETPYRKGIEPGSAAYVERSPSALIRNSCVGKETICCSETGAVAINPRSAAGTRLSEGDVILCKDANIGEAALFSGVAEGDFYHSSGIVKLNIRAGVNKFYVLANLRDNFFLEQLDALTPRGSTIRHAGERFLDCQLPLLRENEFWINGAFEALCLNIAACENLTKTKIAEAARLIHNEIISDDIDLRDPTISDLKTTGRLDAGLYSDVVQTIQGSIDTYLNGSKNIQQFGFKIRRGPNLAKRDLGRSIITDIPRRGYDVLIYPSDIAENGFVLRNSFIGARGPIWHLGCGDLLFSAEGTVGRVFAVCDAGMHFTTNFHGIILSHEGATDLVKTGFLCMYLHFLRAKGFFEKVSVGGQGGSFASQYWSLVRVPNVPKALMKKIAALYVDKTAGLHPLEFNETGIKQAGVYQLSQLRIRSNALLKKMMSDLKADTLQSLADYMAME